MSAVAVTEERRGRYERTPEIRAAMAERMRGNRHACRPKKRVFDRKGYPMWWVGPDHPLAMGSTIIEGGGYSYEHRLVAREAILEAGLEWSNDFDVHHVDDDKTNNQKHNLIVFFQHGDHSRLTQFMRHGRSHDEALAEIDPDCYFRCGPEPAWTRS